LDSYDLDLDQKLAEETTVLVESYTVRIIWSYLNTPAILIFNHSYPTAA
jgi:hypothetical protein